MYRGYKIVGLYPQFDCWELDPATGEATELVEEWDRNRDPEEIQIWTYQNESGTLEADAPDGDGYYSWDGDFDGLEFNTVAEAKAAIDKFYGGKEEA